MKRFSYLIVMLLLSASSFAQGHFILAYDGNGQDHMNIFVVSAKINGVDMEANYEIAAFDNTICCAKNILTQKIVFTDKNTFAILSASKKDEGLSNGYTPGNNIIFKIWDSDKKLELTGVKAEFINPADGQTITPPTFSPGATTFVKLSVTVTVNKTPESKAGADQSVNESENVTLDGTASSDPDGDPITYSWTEPAGIILSSATVANPTFTAPEVIADTVYTFSLIVNDGTVNSTTDEVIIKVKQVNKVPVANAGPDQTLDENSRCTLDCSGSADADGNTLTYLWTAPAGITLSSNTSKNPTFTIPEIKQDSVLSFSLVVSDGITNSEPSTVKVFIKNVIKTTSEIIDIEGIKVYPNPSNGIFSIYGLKSNQQNKVEIYTNDGKLVSQKKSISTLEKMDISFLNSGTYLLLIDKNPFKIIKL